MYRCAFFAAWNVRQSTLRAYTHRTCCTVFTPLFFLFFLPTLTLIKHAVRVGGCACGCACRCRCREGGHTNLQHSWRPTFAFVPAMQGLHLPPAQVEAGCIQSILSAHWELEHLTRLWCQEHARRCLQCMLSSELDASACIKLCSDEVVCC